MCRRQRSSACAAEAPILAACKEPGFSADVMERVLREAKEIH